MQKPVFKPPLIPELRNIQAKHGYLCPDELAKLSSISGIPQFRVQEVASFFPLFKLSPPPPVTVRVCRDLACHLAGSQQLLRELTFLASNDIQVRGVSCLGRCDRAPAVWIDTCRTSKVSRTESATLSASQHAMFVRRNASELKGIIERCCKADIARGDCDRDQDYPSANWIIDPYADTTERYSAIRSILEDQSKQGQDKVLSELGEAKANLRGMGGAGVPAVKKWRDVRAAIARSRRQENDEQAFVIVNGDESEPATFKDRELLLHYPHLIVEGMIIAALITGVSQGFIYIRQEYFEQIEACKAEIERAEAIGLCGTEAPTLGRPFPISVFVSPGGYICGEQSALLEVLSGNRGEPRNVPPMLETNGLRDKPTLISNTETFAWVPYILIHGGENYASLGVNSWKGRRFFSVCGDVVRPGVYEVPMGLTLRELIYENTYCQGVRGGLQIKAIAPSGPSGGFLPLQLAGEGGGLREPKDSADRERRDEQLRALARRRGLNPQIDKLNVLDLELELDVFRTLVDTGALGAGIVIYAADRDMLDQAVNATIFLRNESCGKCVPCRIGSDKLANLGINLLAGRIDTASWNLEILPLVNELSNVLFWSSICSLGRSVPIPLRTVIEWFSHDLHRYLVGSSESSETTAE